MSLKDIPVIREFYKKSKEFEKLEARLIKMDQDISFTQEYPDLALKKNAYKRLISQTPTAWYGHFEKAVTICNILKPATIVDLGVDFAYSTFAFAFLNTGNVYGIDSFEGDSHAGHKNTYDYVLNLYEVLKKDYHIQNVNIIKGYFDEIARTWEAPVDLLHIDGLHTYEAVKNDFTTWKKFFHPKTVVLFHDTVSFKKDVGRFFNELEGYKYNFKDWNGLGVWTMDEEFYRQLTYIYKL